jgi:hypothetical protein
LGIGTLNEGETITTTLNNLPSRTKWIQSGLFCVLT